jgi:hypothetical protein
MDDTDLLCITSNDWFSRYKELTRKCFDFMFLLFVFVSMKESNSLMRVGECGINVT